MAGDELPALSSSTDGGVVSAVLTWQGGKPSTKDFNVLWSKASTEGNWQLNEFGAQTFDVRAVCSGSDTGSGGDTGGDTGGTDPVAPTIALPVDFEEAADAYEIAGFDGGVASVEAGPDGAVSLKYVKGAGANWAGVWINLDTAVDAANGEIVTADVHSTVARDITLKFDAAGVERVASHTGSGWEALSYDFTGAMPADQTKIAFFNDLSQQGDGSADWTIHIDNLAQSTGGTDPVAPADGFQITEAFGDTVIDGSVFTYPAGAQSWGGFANMNTSLYPITVNVDSVITFTGSVPAGGDADVRFRFEFNPHPDVDPSFNTEAVTVTGADAATYSVCVPAQGDKTFSSFLMYLDTRDVGVSVTDIAISADATCGDTGGGDTGGGDTGGSTGSMEPVFDQPFDGTTLENGVYNFPASANAWAGFINSNTAIYPIVSDTFKCVDFQARVPSGNGEPRVYFKLESNPWPNNTESSTTPFIRISGSNWTNYSTCMTSTGDQQWNQLVFYISEFDRDEPLEMRNIELNWQLAVGSGNTGGDTGATIVLPVDFEEAAADYEIAGFDGGVASVEAGPDGANSLKYVKGAGQNWLVYGLTRYSG